MSPAFDSARFLADLQAAGCRVIVGEPIRPNEMPDTFFIAPGRGYSAVMAKWSDAMDVDPDHVGRTVARLVEARESTA